MLPNGIRDGVVVVRVGLAAAIVALRFVAPAVSPFVLVGTIFLTLLGLIVFEVLTTPGAAGTRETGI